PVGVEGMDFPIAGITDEDGAAEPAKGEGGPRHAPWRVQRSARREAPQQMALGVENIDKALARTRHIVMPGRILHGVRDKEVAVNVLDAEGRDPSRYIRIRKAAVDLRRCRRPEAGRPIGGERVDRSGPDVSREG